MKIFLLLAVVALIHGNNGKYVTLFFVNVVKSLFKTFKFAVTI